MKNTPHIKLLRPLLCMALALFLALPGKAQLAHSRQAGTPLHNHAHDDLAGLLNEHDKEIHFLENKGQFSAPVLYRADLPMGQAVATASGMVITAFDPATLMEFQRQGVVYEELINAGHSATVPTWHKKGHTWKLNFTGASADMKVESRAGHDVVSNYFIGGTQATDVRSFQEVWYKNTYRGIDVRYYPAADGSLEYDVICKPGSDPGQIAIQFEGIDRLRVNEKGELVLATSLGEVAYPAPIVYQRTGGTERSVNASYVVEGKNTLRFQLGEYDKNATLVIDPIALRWATWMNTASNSDNHGHCIWVDPADGAIYVVSRVSGGTDQITPGAFDTSTNGSYDMVVGKYLEPTTVGGSGTRVWQTYIGGSDVENPYAMEQGPDGNLYITGYTSSTDYPMLGGTAFSGSSVNQQAQGGEDVYITKINPAGNSIKSAVVGGNKTDYSFDLRIAPNGDVVIGGYTNSTNLATSNPGSGASNTNNGGNDVLLFRVNQDLSAVQWMKNYGGSGNDLAQIMLYDAASGDIFIGGRTTSTNFPTLSPRQSTRGGSEDGFLQRISGTGTTVWSSYFQSASSKSTAILCMAMATGGNELYFGGTTSGLANSNVSASGTYDNSYNGGTNDLFVARMSTSQSFSGSTYVGGSANEVNMMGLNTDQNNDVFVFGYTNSTNFPVSSAPNTPVQSTNMGSNDKVFLKLSSDLSNLIFSTYYGGSGDDYDPVGERGIKFSNCRIYTIVTSLSNNIPLTQGALNTTKNSSQYEPGIVVWANPPDLLGNTISGNQSVCAGSIPGDITGSVPSYSLPTIVRNNTPSTPPSPGSATTYQWQVSTDSLNWVDISGATSQNLPGSLIGAVTEKTYIRRVIGGDACILAGAADQVVTVKLIQATGTVANVSCNGANNGSITASSTGVAPFSYSWSNGASTATINNLAPGQYTVQVTDANGCQDSETFTVTQPAALGGSVQTVNATCNNSNGSATANITGGTSPYTYVWSSGGTGSTENNLAAGTYGVDVTDAHGCTLHLDFSIGAGGTPGANAGEDMVLTCASGGQITLNGSSPASGVIFSWTASNGGNIVSGGNTATPVVNAAGTYTLVVTNAVGCYSTDAAQVTVNMTAPNASASVSDVLTCSMTSVTLNGGSTTTGTAFGWSGPGGFTSTLEDPSVSSPGTYTLTVTDTINGCMGTATAVVELDNEAPGAQATGGVINCNNQCVTLQGTGNGSYSWSGPGGFTSTLQNPEACTAGTYTLTVTGSNGCTSTATAQVTLDNSVPDAGAQGGTLTCTNTTVTLNGSGVGSFSWSGPGGFTSTEEDPTVSVPGTYTLTVTGSNGCSSTATAVVELDNEAPGAQAEGGVINCNNQCVTLQGTGNGSYSWSGPGGFTSTLQNPEACTAGTYTLTVTGSNGCTSTATAQVTLDNSVPDAGAQGGTLTCTNTTVTLNGSGVGSFSWSGPGGFTSTEEDPTVSVPGTYTLTVTGSNGCTSTASAVVELDNEVPGAQAAGGVINCNNQCVTLQGTGNGSYSWSGPGGFASTDQNPQACTAGTYTLTVTGTNGCTSTATAVVELDDNLPDAGAQGGTLTCSDTVVTLNGSGVGSFSWTGPGGFTSTEEDPTVGTPGTYTLTVTGSNGCSSTATAVVELDNEAPGAQAEGGVINCNNQCVTLQGTGNGSYSWSGPGGFTSTMQNPEACTAGTYTLTVTGTNGCTSQATAEVTLDNEGPGAIATGGTLTCAIECITLQGDHGQNVWNGITAYIFSWSGPGGFTSTLQNPTVCEPGTYTLTVTGTNGCTSTATAVVELDNEVPGAQAAGGVINCNNQCVTLQGTGNGSYSWSGPGGFTSALQNPEACTAGTYTLTVTGSNGCTSTATAQVTLDNSVPDAGAQGGTLTCTNTTVTLNGSGVGSFSWSGPGGFTSTEEDPTVSVPGTYTLTVTGSNGCSSTATAVVELDNEAPGAQAEGGVINCNNQCVTLQGTGNGSYSWSGPGGFTSTLQNPEACTAGTYTLTVTGSNGCTSTATAVVELDDNLPDAGAQGGTLTCTDTVVTLNGSGVGSFSWSGPGGFTSTEEDPTVSVPGTYTLTVTGTNGCTSTATAVVELDNEVPGAQAAGGVITCNNQCVTLQGTGNGSYSWSGPGGFTSTLQNPEACTAGTYTLTVTGSNGCTSTATAVVELDDNLPDAGAQGGTLTCTDTVVTLNGSGVGSFSWSGPGGFTSTEEDPTVSVPGTYTLTVTGSNGCNSTATAVVELDNEAPGAQAEGGVITCNNQCITLQGTGNGSYSWSGPDGFTSTLQNPEACTAGTYTLTVTGSNGCTSTATAVVILDKAAPDAGVQGGTITCTNTTVTLNGSGVGSFSWSGPGGFTSTEEDPTVSVPGTYTLTVTGSNGCTSTATAVVELDTEAPGAQAEGGVINCNNQCVTLQGTGNGSYSWSGPGGFTSTLQNPEACTAGTYTLTVTGTNGCTSQATAEVTLDNEGPGAIATGGTLTCAMECITLQGDHGQNIWNGITAYTFSWSGPGGFTSTLQNPTVCEPGTYTLTVTGTNGCSSTATAVVELDNEAPGAQAAGGVITCNNQCVTLQGTGNGSYSWSGPGGFASTDQNPQACTAGTYTLTVTGTNGCTSTATAVVELDDNLPDAGAQGGTLTCSDTVVTLNGSGVGSFSWTGPGGFTSTEEDPTVSVPGTYTLTVTGSNGCSSIATAVVELDNEAPGAQAEGGVINCNNQCVTLTGFGNGSYSWSGPGGFSSTMQNPEACTAGTYTLTVTGSNGCTSTATAQVTLDNEGPGAIATGGTLTCAIECITLQGDHGQNVWNGITAYIFSWSGPGGFTSTLQNPTVCEPGTYTLTVTGTNGCTSTATAVVELDNEVPGAQAAGGVITCNNQCVTLEGAGNGSYSWSGPGGFTSTMQNPEACTAGTYTLTVTGTNGCTSQATAVVTLDNSVPDAGAQGGTLTCSDTVVTLNGSGVGSFSWTGPGGFTSTEEDPTVSNPGTYVLIVTGSNGCTSTATAVVELDNEAPGAQAAGGVITCNNQCVTLEGTGNGSYSWSGPGGFTSTLQNPEACTAGTYTLTVTGTNGCTSTATAEVTLDNEGPGAQAEGGALSCETHTFTLSGSGNGTFQWTGPNGFNSTMQYPIASEVGIYTLTVTGDNGCTSMATTEVVDGDCGGCETPIIIDCGPASTTVECGASIDPEVIGIPVTRKNKDCPEVVYFNYYDEFEGSCPITVTRHWTFRDTDNNEETCTQIILIEDTQAPILFNVPEDATAICADVPAVPTDVWASDCKNTVPVTVEEVIVPGEDSTYYTIHRTFTATDGCLNTATATQVITVIACKEECEAPIIISCAPAFTTVECGASIDPEDIGLPVTRKDPNCPQVIYFGYEDEFQGTCPLTITRHWTFRDVDGNEETCTQIIVVEDTTAPDLFNVPADVTVECTDVPAFSNDVWASDCKNTVPVGHYDEVFPGEDESYYTIVRTYWAADACDNIGYATQTITVIECKEDGTNGMVTLPATDGNGSVTVAPNPFRHFSTIVFTPRISGRASVEVVDLLGKKVAMLLDDQVAKDTPVSVEFNPGSLSGGIYFYRISLNGEVNTGKIMYRP